LGHSFFYLLFLLYPKQLIPLGLNKKLTPNIFKSKIRHENDDIFKNGLSKQGVESFELSSRTNKSIANFRETIPLTAETDFFYSRIYFYRSSDLSQHLQKHWHTYKTSPQQNISSTKCLLSIQNVYRRNVSLTKPLRNDNNFCNYSIQYLAGLFTVKKIFHHSVAIFWNF
jgi:hypothetical protein